jgi:O-antigen ligase
MTRSSWLMAIPGILIWAIFFRHMNFRRIVEYIAGLCFIFIFSVIVTKSIGTYETLVQRVSTLLEPRQTMLEDPSAILRMEQAKIAFIVMPRDFASILFGNGWGTMVYHIEKTTTNIEGGFKTLPESSSNIFISIFFFSGIIGLGIFLFLVYRILITCLKFIGTARDRDAYYFLAQGLFLSFVGMLIAGQIASGWIAPQFWLVIGCAIFLEILQSNRQYNAEDSDSSND